MNIKPMTCVDEKTAINRMNYLRGLFAIMIVIGHSSMMFEKELLPLLVIHKFNMVSVCFFFIVSGWSLTYNFKNKTDYLKGFIINKAVKLFIFAFICEIIDRLISFLILKKPIGIDSGLLTNYNWYVYETIVFYIAFYFSYKYLKHKNLRVLAMAIVSVAVSVFTWYMSNNTETFWTHAFHFSSLCFLWGIVLHEYYHLFKVIIQKKILSSAVLFVLGAASCICLKMPQGSFVGGIILHNIIGICVMTIIALFAHYIDYKKIPIVGFLTSYSTEIYLYQFMMLTICAEVYTGWGGKND